MGLPLYMCTLKQPLHPLKLPFFRSSDPSWGLIPQTPLEMGGGVCVCVPLCVLWSYPCISWSCLSSGPVTLAEVWFLQVKVHGITTQKTCVPRLHHGLPCCYSTEVRNVLLSHQYPSPTMSWKAGLIKWTAGSLKLTSHLAHVLKLSSPYPLLNLLPPNFSNFDSRWSG